jgi:tRNA-specific 2-thiouridylase
MNKKVVVAMSGGVDSSVACLLLQEEGYDVIGVTMKLYDLDMSQLPINYQGCCTVDDVEDARRVCNILSIPHYVFNVQKEFQQHVIDYFCEEYQNARTPHPCIACNDKIKFNFLRNRALLLGADYVATGHYARIVKEEDEFLLKKGIDASKDQSYVLFGMGQKELSTTLMPCGKYEKTEIRSFALSKSFPNANKGDSQDICFIPFGDYKEFLKTKIEPTPGNIIDETGKILTKHKGIEFFTIGQRRGLGIESDKPMYVIDIDPDSKNVTVGGEDKLFKQSLLASRVNFTSDIFKKFPQYVTVKIRYKSEESSATLINDSDDNVILKFDKPQRAITPGQAVVFYKEDTLVGGGVIERHLDSNLSYY